MFRQKRRLFDELRRRHTHKYYATVREKLGTKNAITVAHQGAELWPNYRFGEKYRRNVVEISPPPCPPPMYVYISPIETSKTQLLSKIRTMAFFFQMRLEKVFFTRTNAVSVSHQISLVFDDLRGHVSFSDKTHISFFSKMFCSD